LNILFEFLGGPNDGQVVQGRLGDCSDAERLYLFTDRGRVGQHFKIASQYVIDSLAQVRRRDEALPQFHLHFYTVSECVEEADEVWIQATYLPGQADRCAS